MKRNSNKEAYMSPAMDLENLNETIICASLGSSTEEFDEITDIEW